MTEPKPSNPLASPTASTERSIDGDSKPPGVVRRWLRGWRFILTFVVAFWVASLPIIGLRTIFMICGLNPNQSVVYDALVGIYFFTGFPLAVRAMFHYFDVHVVR